MNRIFRLLCGVLSLLFLLFSLASCEKTEKIKESNALRKLEKRFPKFEWTQYDINGGESLEEVQTMFAELKKEPELLVYQPQLQKNISKLNYFYCPDQIPENFLFQGFQFYGSLDGDGDRYYYFKYSYTCRLELWNNKTEKYISRDCKIQYEFRSAYKIHIKEREIIIDSVNSFLEIGRTEMTKDGVLYEQYEDDRIYFNTPIGVANVSIDIGNGDLTVPYEYLLSLCKWKAISLTDDQTEISGEVIKAAVDPTEIPILLKFESSELELLKQKKQEGTLVLQEYLAQKGDPLYTEETVSDLLALLATFPIPTVPNGRKDFRLLYYPQSLTIHLLYPIQGDEHYYRFEIPLDPFTRKELRETQLGADAHQVVIDAVVGNVLVDKLLRVELDPTNIHAKNYTEIWLDTEGYIIKVVYRNNYQDVYLQTTESILQNVTFKLPTRG